MKVRNTFWERVLIEQSRNGRHVPGLPKLPKAKRKKSPTHSAAPKGDLRAQVLETIQANHKLEDE